MYIPFDPLDFDVYRTLVISQRIFIRSLLRGKAEPEHKSGISATLNAITNYAPIKKRTYSNQEIVDGIYLNDADTFNFIVEVAYKPIERFIRKDKGSVPDAEDVFVDAIEQLRKVVCKGNFVLNNSVEAYLYKIAVHLWAEINRKRNLPQPNDPDPEDPELFGGTLRPNRPNDPKKPDKPKISRAPKIIPLDNMDMEKVGTIFDESMVTDDYPEDYEVIERYIGYYSDRCQELLREHYYNKKDWKQVAVDLGYANAESAKQQCSKCKNGFLQKIKKGKIQIDEKLVNPKYLTKIQAGKYLGISGKTISHLIKSDQINQSVIVNGKKQFTQDDLNLYINNTITDFAFCNKNFIKFDLLNQKYYPFLWITLYPIIHQNRSWIYLHLEGWGKVRFSWKEFNQYFSIADEAQKFAFKCNIFI